MIDSGGGKSRHNLRVGGGRMGEGAGCWVLGGNVQRMCVCKCVCATSSWVVSMDCGIVLVFGFGFWVWVGGWTIYAVDE